MGRDVKPSMVIYDIIQLLSGQVGRTATGMDILYIFFHISGKFFYLLEIREKDQGMGAASIFLPGLYFCAQ